MNHNIRHHNMMPTNVLSALSNYVPLRYSNVTNTHNASYYHHHQHQHRQQQTHQISRDTSHLVQQLIDGVDHSFGSIDNNNNNNNYSNNVNTSTSSQKVVVIEGEAGCGKTLFGWHLYQTAVDSLAATYDDQQDNNNRHDSIKKQMIPIFISLHQYRDLLQSTTSIAVISSVSRSLSSQSSRY